jgi:hypothetical protein
MARHPDSSQNWVITTRPSRSAIRAAIVLVATAANLGCTSDGKHLGGVSEGGSMATLCEEGGSGGASATGGASTTGGTSDAGGAQPTGGTTAAAGANCASFTMQLRADQGLIIDNFETDRHDITDVCLLNDPKVKNPNLLGKCSACFNNCANNCPDITGGSIETSLTTKPEDALWCSGRSLIVDYDMSDGVGGARRTDRFAGYVASVSGTSSCPCTANNGGAIAAQCADGSTPACVGIDIDQLGLNFVSFWVRFETTLPNPDVEVAIKDVCGVQTYGKRRAISGGFGVEHWGAWTKVKVNFTELQPNGVNTHGLQEISFTFAQGTGYAPSGRMFLDDIAFER